MSGGSISISESTFEHISGGAMQVESDAVARLSDVTFTDNVDSSLPPAAKYPAFQQNILCSKSILSVSVSPDADVFGSDTSAPLWIVQNDCVTSGALAYFPSVLFVPSIESVSCAVEKEGITFTFTGSSLFSCGLSFALNISGTIKDGYSLTTTDSDTTVLAFFPRGSLEKDERTALLNRINTKSTVMAQLVFGTRSSSVSEWTGVALSGAALVDPDVVTLPLEWTYDYTPPDYQIVLVATLAAILFLVSVSLCLCYCLRNPYKTEQDIPPLEPEPKTLVRLLTVVLSIIKFSSLISLSFLPQSESTTNTSSIFSSSAFLNTLFQFGQGVFGFYSDYSIYGKFFAALSIISLTNITGVLLPVSLCALLALPQDSPINRCIGRLFQFQYIVIDLVCDLLFESLIDWISPILSCTHYDLTDAQIALLKLDYVGKEASCVGATRVALYAASLVMLILFFVVWAFIFCTYLPDARQRSQAYEDEESEMADREAKRDSYYKNTFTISQNFAQTVMVGVAVLFSDTPILVYSINLGCLVVLVLVSVHVYIRGCRILRRRLNIVFYLACILTTLVSLIMELLPELSLPLSILNLVIVILAVIISVIVAWMGFAICKKDEIDILSCFVTSPCTRCVYDTKPTESTLRSEEREMEAIEDEWEDITKSDLHTVSGNQLETRQLHSTLNQLINSNSRKRTFLLELFDIAQRLLMKGDEKRALDESQRSLLSESTTSVQVKPQEKEEEEDDDDDDDESGSESF